MFHSPVALSDSSAGALMPRGGTDRQIFVRGTCSGTPTAPVARRITTPRNVCPARQFAKSGNYSFYNTFNHAAVAFSQKLSHAQPHCHLLKIPCLHSSLYSFGARQRISACPVHVGVVHLGGLTTVHVPIGESRDYGHALVFQCRRVAQAAVYVGRLVRID